MKDALLLSHIVCRANGVSEREVGEGEAGHGDLVDDVAGRADDERGNGVGFEVACGQTDRLVAHRSERDEHCEVDIVFF